MKKKLKWAALAAVAAAAAFAVYWFGLRSEPQTAYLTEAARRGDIRQTVSATGEISAAQLVDVGAQSSGQIKFMHVRLGQQVEAGDLIAEIDSTTQVNTLNTNKARLESYQAQLVSARIALRNAERKYRREQALWAENATSKELLDEAQGALAQARAQIGEIQSNIKQARIAINTAEADLGYTRITSPIKGTVVSVKVEHGQTVNSQQTSPTIAQVADLSRMLNKMQIAEGDITKVRPGQTLSFTTLADPDQERTATLESVDPGLTTMSQGSYTASTDTSSNAIYYYARTMIPNEDGRLSIGMTTQNQIVIGKAENVLTVPAMAVKQREGRHYVRILNARNEPEERSITVGISDGTRTEVKSGLNEGDQVIVSEGSSEVKEWQGGPGGPRM